MLPICIMEVVDENLLNSEDEHFAAKSQRVSSFLKLALECTNEPPEKRINAKKKKPYVPSWKLEPCCLKVLQVEQLQDDQIYAYFLFCKWRYWVLIYGMNIVQQSSLNLNHLRVFFFIFLYVNQEFFIKKNKRKNFTKNFLYMKSCCLYYYI